VLSRKLSERYNCEWVPEYAREYIENISHQYTFEDVEKIAKHQLIQEHEAIENAKNNIVIFDTWLIITKVWFEVAFGKCPQWIIEHISNTKIDLFIVCNYDLPWVSDSVRENGGEKRKLLFERYCKEIEVFGYDYNVVSGEGEDRINNAINMVSGIL
jgi:nicotinamide riboside kinase